MGLEFDPSTGQWVDRGRPSAPVAYHQPASQPVAQEVRQPTQPVAVLQPVVVHGQGVGGQTIYQEEKYCGPVTCCWCIVLTVIFWPVALFVPCFPCDKRQKLVTN